MNYSDIMLQLVCKNEYLETKEEKAICMSALNAAINWVTKVDIENRERMMRMYKDKLYKIAYGVY